MVEESNVLNFKSNVIYDMHVLELMSHKEEGTTTIINLIVDQNNFLIFAPKFNKNTMHIQASKNSYNTFISYLINNLVEVYLL